MPGSKGNNTMGREQRGPKKLVIANYLVLATDVVLIIIAIFLAYLLRFNFSIPAKEIEPLPWIILYISGIRMVILLLGRSYSEKIRFMNLIEVLRIYLLNILGSVVFIVTNIVSYYLINDTLFIPLTIVILEFLSTSFLLIIFRSLINVSYSKNVEKRELEKIAREKH